jgi:hypothetical protein
MDKGFDDFEPAVSPAKRRSPWRTLRGRARERRWSSTTRRPWIFSELTRDSFEWRAEETTPGSTPRVRQWFHARRVTDGQATA